VTEVSRKSTLHDALPGWLRTSVIRAWLAFIGIGIAFQVGNTSGHSFDLLKVIAPPQVWAILFYVTAFLMLISERLQRIDLMRWSMTLAGGLLVFIAGADLWTFFSEYRSGLFAAVAYAAIAASCFQTAYELAKRD
jgi:hypothetical protein